MRRRTEIQLALLVVGIVAWGVGQRMDIVALQYTGIGFFAAATALRFFKKKTVDEHDKPE
ncbi:MAG: hypothetical protein ACREPM_18350 [Gemmatimonadaceae bacterium]